MLADPWDYRRHTTIKFGTVTLEKDDREWPNIDLIL